MTNQPTIVSTARGTATRKGHRDAYAGERVEMSDGSAWFHPYNGSAPFQLRAPTKTEENF